MTKSSRPTTPTKRLSRPQRKSPYGTPIRTPPKYRNAGAGAGAAEASPGRSKSPKTRSGAGRDTISTSPKLSAVDVQSSLRPNVSTNRVQKRHRDRPKARDWLSSSSEPSSRNSKDSQKSAKDVAASEGCPLCPHMDDCLCSSEEKRLRSKNVKEQTLVENTQENTLLSGATDGALMTVFSETSVLATTKSDSSPMTAAKCPPTSFANAQVTLQESVSCRVIPSSIDWGILGQEVTTRFANQLIEISIHAILGHVGEHQPQIPSQPESLSLDSRRGQQSSTASKSKPDHIGMGTDAAVGATATNSTRTNGGAKVRGNRQPSGSPPGGWDFSTGKRHDARFWSSKSV